MYLVLTIISNPFPKGKYRKCITSEDATVVTKTVLLIKGLKCGSNYVCTYDSINDFADFKYFRWNTVLLPVKKFDNLLY